MIVGIYCRHLKSWINVQMLISELGYMHYTECKGRERGRRMRARSQIMSISVAFSQILSMKATVLYQCIFLYICNYFIKYYISPAAHCCLVQRKFGIMAQSPNHVHTYTRTHTHSNIALFFPFFSPSCSLFLSHSGTVQQCQHCPRLTDHRKEQHF